MNHRILIALGTLLLGATAATAQAGDRDWRDDGYRYNAPEEQRWNEEQVYRPGPGLATLIGDVLIGAVVSGLIGHDGRHYHHNRGYARQEAAHHHETRNQVDDARRYR